MILKNIVTPDMGESITEATVVSIKYREGNSFSRHDILFDLETEKVNIVVSAESAGTLKKLFVKKGDVVTPGSILGEYEELSQ